MIKRIALILILFTSPVFAEEGISDPWETYNRSIFSFNEVMDSYLAEPVARGYDKVTPKPVQTGVSNFFQNLRYPQYVVSDLIQLDFKQLAIHTGRFLTNTTIGIGGIFDVAQHFGLEHKQSDVGLALARNGVGTGPYWVLPFLGPSNVRDAIGLAVDTALFPPFWLGYSDKIDSKDALAITSGLTVLEFTNRRADLLEAIDSARDASLDYYLFLQSSYYQYRAGVVAGDEVDSFYDDKFSITDDEYVDDDPFADEY